MAYPTDPIYKFVKDSSDNRNISVMKKNGDHNIYIPITSGSVGNTDYQAYLEWSKTNTAEEAD